MAAAMPTIVRELRRVLDEASIHDGESGTPPVKARARAASAVSVTGEALATGSSQFGSVETGTKTELAKTSGNRSTNPAVCAVSAPRTTRETKAKIQLSANPKPATRATQPSAAGMPAWKRKPTR